MVDMKNTLLKMIGAVIVPIVGVPLYDVGFTQMNDSFGGTDNEWAVTIYTVLYVLTFALIPIGLVYSIFRDFK